MGQLWFFPDEERSWQARAGEGFDIVPSSTN
jgi:hypothetical protein